MTDNTKCICTLIGVNRWLRRNVTVFK